MATNFKDRFDGKQRAWIANDNPFHILAKSSVSKSEDVPHSSQQHLYSHPGQQYWNLSSGKQHLHSQSVNKTNCKFDDIKATVLKVSPSDISPWKSYDHMPCRHIKATTIPLPVIKSYGLAPYDPVNDKWLLVRRKYNPAFLILMRGSYRDSDLTSLLGALSKKEAEIIKLMVQSPDNISNIHWFFFESLLGVDYCRKRFSSQYMISLAKNITGTGDGEWLFPSGRPEIGESNIATAIREYHEEGGIPEKDFIFDNVIHHPVIERMEISMKLHFRYYYPYIVSNSKRQPVISSNDPEIIESRWVTSKEAMLLLSADKYKVLLIAKAMINDYNTRVVS